MAHPAHEPIAPDSHSGWGISSFIVSLVANIGLALTLLASGVADLTTPGGLDKDSLAAGLLGLLLLAMLGGLLISLILGIVGSVQQRRRKIFAILGTVFSGVGLVGGILLILIGIAVG